MLLVQGLHTENSSNSFYKHGGQRLAIAQDKKGKGRGLEAALRLLHWDWAGVGETHLTTTWLGHGEDNAQQSGQQKKHGDLATADILEEWWNGVSDT